VLVKDRTGSRSYVMMGAGISGVHAADICHPFPDSAVSQPCRKSKACAVFSVKGVQPVIAKAHTVILEWLGDFMFEDHNKCYSGVLKYCVLFMLFMGGCGEAGTALQTGRSWVRFPMVSLEFLIGIILSVALWPWGRFSL
jgi:hypothetical protein